MRAELNVITSLFTDAKVEFSDNPKIIADTISLRRNRWIWIPASVEILAERCFSGCKSLSAVTIESESQLVPIDGQAFSACSSLKSISNPASVYWEDLVSVAA
jgi:hypothetical protein